MINLLNICIGIHPLRIIVGKHNFDRFHSIRSQGDILFTWMLRIDSYFRTLSFKSLIFKMQY